MTNLSFHLSGVIADHCRNLGRVGKIETLPILQICSRWSQTIGDIYDFEFSLVGKIWDGQETVKSQTVWGFPGIWKPGFRTFVSSFPTSPGNVLNCDVNIALIAFCSLAVKKIGSITGRCQVYSCVGQWPIDCYSCRLFWLCFDGIQFKEVAQFLWLLYARCAGVV